MAQVLTIQEHDNHHLFTLAVETRAKLRVD